MKKHALSKSTFLRAVQCPKSLYLYQYYKKLREPYSADRQALLNRGHAIGSLAWECFPEGVDGRVGNKFMYGKAVEKTQRLIQQGVSTIFEATFQQNQVLVMVDVLTQRNGYWEAYEVKSSARVSSNHIRDAALQYHVMEQAGLPLQDFQVMHIDKSYKRQGALDVHALFTSDSVIREVRKQQPWIRKNIDYGKQVLQKPTVPKVSIGKHCSDPYPCDFISYCWQQVPQDSVFEIGHLAADTKFDYFRKGYAAIQDLQPESIESPAVAIQVRSHQQQEPYLEQKALSHFLSGFRFPLFFMDFEAIMPAVPVFDQTRPFQKIPFQFSIHHLSDPAAALQHREFLAEPGTDPHGRFLEQLLADTEGTGNLVVFEDTLERQMLEGLKKQFPDYSAAIQNRLDRIIDLRYPFKHMHYYHPAMKGSFSLQAIYEALFGRDEVEKAIEDGGIAAIKYEQLLNATDTAYMAEEKEKLLAYCQKDTLALAEIYRFLSRLVTT